VRKRFPKPRPRAPWRIKKLALLGEWKIFVTFLDGTSGEVDFKKFLFNPKTDGTVFESLREPDEFAKAGLELGAVTWPNGADIAPDAMHEEVKKNGRWVL